MSDFDSGVVRISGIVQTSGLKVTPLAGNGIVNVPDNLLSTVVTYTAPSDKQVSSVTVSGTVYAKFQLFLNTILIETRRGGPERTLVFEFNNPLVLNSGDVLDVKVTHYQTGLTAEFESTVYGG
jgi:hypothetical protein